MNEVLAVLVAVAGGLAGGLVGVGGGVLFVPALTIFLGLTQVEAESTSLLMIVIVALVGAIRQNGYGNVHVATALLLSIPAAIGVVLGTAIQQRIPQRAVSYLFALLLVAIAVELILS